MKMKIKIIISIILLIILLFASAYDRIDYICSNMQLLKTNNIPEDINIDAVKNTLDNYTGYDTFINGIGKGLIPIAIIICPIVLGYLFSGRFAYDLKTGFGNFIISRQKFKTYFIKVILKTFTYSFMVVFLAELFFLIICLAIWGNKTPTELYSQVVDSIKWMYYKIPFLYCIIHIIKQSLYMAILTTIGMNFALFTRNKFIIALSPFIIYLLINIICPILDMNFDVSFLKLIYPDYLIMSFMTGTYLFNNPLIHTIGGFTIYALTCVILLLCTYKKYNKNYLR